MSEDGAEIERIVGVFFDAFTSGPDVAERIATLRPLFLPSALIVRTCGGEPTVYDLESFITPRLALLAGGQLTDFREWVLTGRTDVFGDIAQHWCSYAKEWVEDGVAVGGRGMKSLQFVRTGDGWRISGAVWDDEREGLALP